MPRGGRTKTREVSERRCIATGASQPKPGLIRFAIGPGNAVVPDLAEKLPGRGIWVSAERAALTRAVKKNLFPRGAKAPVVTPPDLVAEVEALLAHRLISLVSLARKAGQALAGAEKVKS